MIECSVKLFNDKIVVIKQNINSCFIKTYSKEIRAKGEKLRKKGEPAESTNCD
jgi:hypothetical protein